MKNTLDRMEQSKRTASSVSSLNTSPISSPLTANLVSRNPYDTRGKKRYASNASDLDTSATTTSKRARRTTIFSSPLDEIAASHAQTSSGDSGRRLPSFKRSIRLSSKSTVDG